MSKPYETESNIRRSTLAEEAARRDTAHAFAAVASGEPVGRVISWVVTINGHTDHVFAGFPTQQEADEYARALGRSDLTVQRWEAPIPAAGKFTQLRPANE